MPKPQERSTRTTVLIAGAANVFVAAIKVVARRGRAGRSDAGR